VEIRTSVATCLFIFGNSHLDNKFPFKEPYRASLQVVFELAAMFTKTLKKKLYILCTNAETLLIIIAKFGLQNREGDINIFKIPNLNITREILM
jgi:hypothetical protein